MMSSGTSTDIGLEHDGTVVDRARRSGVRTDAVGDGRSPADPGMQAWQFFVLAGLACATAATFLARGQGLVPILLFSVLMGGAVLVGLAVLRSVAPLVSAHDDRTAMIGHRTRAALEREKMLALRAIKELEFDRAMGKLSEADFTDMSGRLRARAARLMRQLDSGGGYRDRVERDLAKRLEQTVDASRPPATRRAEATACAACATANDPDAKFCKNCGQKL